MNYTYKTDFRGTLYIHSAGRLSIDGMPDFSEMPVPVIHEFNEQMNRIESMASHNRFINIPEQGIRIVLKDENSQDQRTIREYNFLARVYNFYRKHPDEVFFHSNAIVGKVELAEITHHADSPWAKEEHFHWVLRKPKLFETPIKGVREPGSRGIWQYDIPD